MHDQTRLLAHGGGGLTTFGGAHALRGVAYGGEGVDGQSGKKPRRVGRAVRASGEDVGVGLASLVLTLQATGVTMANATFLFMREIYGAR